MSSNPWSDLYLRQGNRRPPGLPPHPSQQAFLQQWHTFMNGGPLLPDMSDWWQEGEGTRGALLSAGLDHPQGDFARQWQAFVNGGPLMPGMDEKWRTQW